MNCPFPVGLNAARLNGGSPSPLNRLRHGVNHGKKSLIGKFLGKPPPLDFVKCWVSRIWSTFGFQSVLDLDEGFFIFHFDSIDSANRALTEGPWIYRGDVLRLMPWEPLFCRWEEMFTTSPVWIRLQSLPLELWHYDSIVVIAQSFGKMTPPLPLLVVLGYNSKGVTLVGKALVVRALLRFLDEVVLGLMEISIFPWTAIVGEEELT
ncbi:hypothetical protein Cni_G01941 [Canna indica]|uniref:DUF4283 domain-containing protein n=1 Tax=Canna indica TaxID=4628 RepID=A0AAQ3JNS9_9LILI|nr:hypothetical protein Cni_G01941 [Canna indica]